MPNIPNPQSGDLIAASDFRMVAKGALAPHFEFIGDLSFCAGFDDVLYIEAGFTITEILVYAGMTPASGSIQIDVLAASTPGGSLASLYTTNTKPSLACTGAGASQIFTGSNLPNTLAVAAGSILAVRILQAPLYADNLTVIVR